jgi:hypothetical protein
MQLKKEIVTLQNLIDACEQTEERAQLRTKMNEKTLRFHILMEKRGQTAAYRQYREQVRKRLG